MANRYTRREVLRTGALAGVAVAAGISSLPPDYAAARAPIDPAALKKLGRRLKGQLIRAGDPGYDAARRVWNFRFDPRPAAIVRCAEGDDVSRCVDFARRHEVVASVRSGGHSQAGLSVCNGGIVIDLSHMKRIAVDPRRAIARAEPGLTRIEFERTTQKHGLVTAMGQCQDVGIGGLVLGGGEGVLAGTHGAACDNVVGSRIVLADGRAVQADREHGADLLWGICGGAGNLGAVTELTLRLYPLHEAVAGWIWYPLTQARDVLRAYRGFAAGSTPDALWTEINLTRPDDRELMLGVFVFHGDSQRAEEDLARVRKLGRPLKESVKRQPYLDAQAAAGFPVWWGWSSYQRSGFVPEITDELIGAIVEMPPPPAADLWFAHLHGEISRRPLDFNAYHQRRPGFTFWAEADWQGAEPREAVAWVDRIWKVAKPATDGVYVNMLDVEPGREKEAYGPNYERLARLKAKYDPDNFFRMNVNVTPA
ncbi:MAG TPA: FAD-binding oxidoreductase [Candidatus Binataceae bacterium]|jgi:FAD/FMN-containing dehydrogenase|nr:FAD-binding oxidoreductase [Candidatus Binataceae bacterium]